MPRRDRQRDGRPPIAIGHLTLRVGDVLRSTEFFRALGLRPVVTGARMAILELRGGTHLMLFPARRKPTGANIRSFDLMVDDVVGFRHDLQARGIEVSSLHEDQLGGHLWFELIDPDGRALAVYSSHTAGRAV